MRAGTAALTRRAVVRFGLALAAGALATSACSDSTDSGTGTLRVTAVTTGPNADAAYQVSVDGGEARALPANTAMTFDALTPGSHSILLTDIAPNCSVGGANPVTVTVGQGATRNAVFTVACTPDPTSAALRVTTFTTGPGAPGTFSLLVDSSAAGSAQSATIPANGAMTINVPAGTHKVTLAVPLNCAVNGPNSASVTAAAGSTATLHFDVSCGVGAPVRVKAVTTGPGAPATYTVGIDGGSSGFVQSATIAANGSVSLTVPTGEHTVTLVTPLNCTVANSNTASVTVQAGRTTDLSFAVTCTLPGKLRVTVATTGSNLDSAYSVRVDGLATKAVATNASIVFDSVGAGNHTVELLDVDANCTVTGANPATATVAAGATTDLHVAVTCIAYGSLRMTVTTTGADIPAQFRVTLEPDYLSNNVLPNGATSVTLPPGPHTATLIVPQNCSVTSPNGVSVAVPPGIVTDIAFAVSCAANGTVRVTVTTTGANAPGSYLVEVDPGNSYISFGISPNGTASHALPPGPHAVELFVPGGCEVTSANGVPVAVVSGATVDVAFTVVCVPNGTLKVTVVTSGSNAPPNYEVTIYPEYVYDVVAANGSSSFSLTAGRHIVSLFPAQNCTVNPAYASADIVTEATTEIMFTVSCQ